MNFNENVSWERKKERECVCERETDQKKERER